MKRSRSSTMLCALALWMAAPFVWAGEVPPAGSKPLSEILRSVEQHKPEVISKAEFDDGVWEVKACDAGACQKLYIDPKSGAEKRRRKTDSEHLPPAGAMPLSTVVQSIEKQGLGEITEVEFEDGSWEVKLRKDGHKAKLFVDPLTGATR